MKKFDLMNGIPHAHIKDAVLNTEGFFIKKQQSLLIDSDNNKYMFNLFENIDNDYSFPFNIRATEKKSFFGKLIIFGIVIFIINIIIDIAQYVS